MIVGEALWDFRSLAWNRQPLLEKGVRLILEIWDGIERGAAGNIVNTVGLVWVLDELFHQELDVCL